MLKLGKRSKSFLRKFASNAKLHQPTSLLIQIKDKYKNIKTKWDCKACFFSQCTLYDIGILVRYHTIRNITPKY
ncbi:uncharacterized protein SOCG_05719 [Schizosaccharomyces octosporus yFS286]|uniref:Uncharacterized protein n=1 Tax=Schizosaccharomyces octosporus (strain yFS286) TaxID=483514 RepID=S9PZP3_SCHOY|nr:uncharacterized protein SOCG_05719 [Schizosaccharomyces octosporus yFS286]EPX72928.1 hypothetical protein SOCG_05719 [Schizosaccharomyces octosporus yFS286]